MKSSRNVKFVCTAGAAIVLAFVTFCAFQVPQISTKYSVRQFFPEDHPALKVDDQIEKTFSLQTAPAFLAVLELKDRHAGGWLEPQRLKALKVITDRMTELPGVKSAISLGTVEMAINRKKELRVGTLADAVPRSQWESHVASQPLLSPQLISRDRRSVLILVEPKVSSSTGLQALEKRIRAVLQKHASEFHAGLGGVPAVQSRLSDKLQTEVGRFMILCLLIFCGMFALFYKNWSPVVFAGLGLIVCNLVVVGLLSFFGIPFTVLLSTLPIITSIAFVSLAIHTLHLWADRLNESGMPTDLPTRWRLSWKVLREIALGNFLGSLTTAIGFLALVSAPIPAIRDYGWVISAAVMGVFVLTQFAMTFALPWFTPVQRQWTRNRAWWTFTVTRWSAPIFVTVVGLSVFFGGSVFELNFSARLFDDLPAKEAVHKTMTTIDRKFGGTVGLDLTIDAGHRDAWTDPAGLKALRTVLDEIRTVRGVGSALGLTDFFDRKLPASRAAVSETFFLFSMASRDPLRQFVDNSSRKTRIAVRLSDLSSKRVDEVRAEIRERLEKKFPKGQIIETGLAVNSHTINREVAQQLVYGFWHSLLMIAALLVIVFRSVRWALVACLPNLVPPAVLIGALALFQTPVKPSIALIFSIALGLAFNNTVYLLTRLHRLRSEKKMSILPLKRTLLEEGNPCLSESLLTFAGFLIFLSSDFQLNQTFGAYMVLSIFAGAIGDLVFLPAVLRIFPEIMGGRKATSSKEPQEKPREKISKPPAAAAVFVGLAFVGASTYSPSADANEALKLLEQSRRKVEARSDQADVKLTILEPNGDRKVRRLSLKTLNEEGVYRALVRIESPANIKGTALLAEVKGENENQWLYLPSSRQVRRVVAAKTSTGVLGSELHPDDLNSAALKGAKAKLVKKSKTMALIEIQPKRGTSVYSKALLSLKLPEALPMKLEYQSKGKTMKTVEFKDYVSPNGKIYRARKIVIRNKANKRGTDIEFSSMKVNPPLKASAFSVSALKNSSR